MLAETRIEKLSMPCGTPRFPTHVQTHMGVLSESMLSRQK